MTKTKFLTVLLLLFIVLLSSCMKRFNYEVDFEHNQNPDDVYNQLLSWFEFNSARAGGAKTKVFLEHEGTRVIAVIFSEPFKSLHIGDMQAMYPGTFEVKDKVLKLKFGKITVKPTEGTLTQEQIDLTLASMEIAAEEIIEDLR